MSITNDPIRPDTFVERMSAHWTETLGNVVSPELQAVWRTMGETFNRQIADTASAGAAKFRVLQPATGSGKSQGTTVYCSMLADLSNPLGVLLVVRLKVQADDLAKTVNQLAGREIASAHHGDNRLTAEECERWQVLIVTHVAYLIDVDEARLSRNADGFQSWNHGERALTVIDESLDVVAEARIDEDSVARLSNIPPEVLRAHPAAWEAIRTMRDLLDQIGTHHRDAARVERVTWNPEEKNEWTCLVASNVCESIDDLRKAIRSVPFDRLVLGRRNEESAKAIRQGLDAVLADIAQAYAGWQWSSMNGKRLGFNSARMVIPAGVNGAVVLDATATVDLTWKLWGNRAEIIPIPTNPRRYDNVTIHVKRMKGLGKGSMIAKVNPEFAQKVVDSVQHRDDVSKLLVVTNKMVEHHFVGVNTSGLEAFDVIHWGAIDGRNDFQDFDAVLIIGLQYRPRFHSANVYFALQGMQDDKWLRSPSQRRFEEHADIRRAIETGQLATDVIQACNRVRCRRVIDDLGNCPRTNVFIATPPDKTGDHIKSELKREMRRVGVDQWHLQVRADEKPGDDRQRNIVRQLVRYLEGAPAGVIRFTDVREALHLSKRDYEQLSLALKGNAINGNRFTGADMAIDAAGWAFIPGKRGRGAVAQLIRTVDLAA